MAEGNVETTGQSGTPNMANMLASTMNNMVSGISNAMVSAIDPIMKGIAQSLQPLMFGLINALITALPEALAVPLAGIVAGIVEAIGAGATTIVAAIIAAATLVLAFIAGLGFIALLKLMQGINDGVSGLLNMVGIIGKLLGMMVMPFANLLIPLLIPLIMILMPIAKFLNMTLRPLFMILMKVFGQTWGNIGGAIGQFLAGKIDLGQLISLVTTEITSSWTMLIQEAMPIIQELLNQLSGFANMFLTLNLDDMHDTINNLFGKELGGAVNGLIDALYYAASSIAGFIVGLVGEDTVKAVMPDLDLDAIEATNEGFVQGKDFASVFLGFIDTLISLYDQLQLFLTALVENPADALWGMLSTTITDIASIDFKTVWDDVVIPTLNTLVEAINTATLDLFGEDGKGGVWLTVMTTTMELSGAISRWVNLMDAINPANIMSSAIKAFVKTLSGGGDGDGGGGTGARNDFISRPGQNPVNFSPNDTIIGVKNPSSLGGSSGGAIYNITINGNGERYIADLVKRAVENVNSKASRAGAYQRGF